MPRALRDDEAPVRRRLSAHDRRQVIEAAATELFAERGYHRTSIDEIARHSGVSVPVVYDHFRSKRELYQSLIERRYAELRAIWFHHASRDLPLGEWLGPAIDDWFGYIEEHRSAGRMLFRDTTGDPEIAAAHRAIQHASRDELLPLLAAITGSRLDRNDPHALELAWETLRAVLQGLALWWYDHPTVPRQTIVAGAMNAIWVGLDRFLAGEAWAPAGPSARHRPPRPGRT